MKNRIAVFVAVGVAHAATAATNEPAETIDGLVARALAGNPEIRFYEARIEIGKAELRTAGQWENPELSVGAGHKRVSGGGSPIDHGYAISASLAQRIEFPQRVQLRKAIANGQIELARLGLQKFRATIGNRIRTAVFGYQAAAERARAAGRVADRTAGLLAALVQRDPAGVAPLLERRVIEAHVISLRRQVRSFETEAERHEQELAYLIAAPAERAINLAELRPALPTPVPDGALLAMGETNSFDLLFHAAELEQQGYRVKLARHERLPEVTLEPFFARETGGGAQNIVGLGISLPLPIWNRNEGDIAAAQARETQLQAAFGVTLRRLHRDLIFHAHAYRAAWTRLQEWRPEAVGEFRKAAEMGDRHFRLGAIPVATYLELQTQYLDAIDTLLSQREEAYDQLLAVELLTGTTLSHGGRP